MKVFLDTNALIYFAHNDGYVFPSEFELITFEKCIYEFGLGFKSRLLDQEFIIHSIKGEPLQSDKIEQQFIVEVVNDVILDTIDALKLTEQEILSLISALKKYNLRWEFGTTDEHPFLQELYAEFIGIRQKDDGLLILKRFFEANKYRLVEKIREQLAKLNVKVISYGQIFGNPKHLLDFAELLENSTIPNKDLEIAFAALSQRCTVFITDDGKKEKGIFQGLQTLGLEYPTECVSIENFVSGRYFSKP